ncbi:putative licABCH operon regulator [compost metagenome]
MIVGGLNEAGYSMTDSDVDLLTVDFLLSCKRIQLGFYAELPEQDISSSNLVQKFIGELERAFHIHVGAGDQAYLEQSFKAKRVMKMDSEEITIEDETKEISNHLMEEIQHKYGYDFTDNPLREEVKKNYPLAVEIATAIIPILQRKLHLVINESELTYIALHIAVALEEKIEKQRVAILCGSGLSTAQLVKRRLLSSFGDQIDIIGHFPLYQLPKVASGEFGAVHLIITTLPIQGSYDIPIVHVNSLVTNEDVAKVNRFLNKAAYPVTRDERACGYSFLDSELYVRFGNEGYLEGIACLCKKLHNTGYIQNESEFYDSVLKRETLYSTIMDCAVAIPHPMEAVSKKSVIAIGTFPTPIRYQGRKIKLILLFAVNTKEQDLLTMMYGKIEALLDSPGRINEAAQATTYDEFLEVFNKL